jgi:hypothetical protein
MELKEGVIHKYDAGRDKSIEPLLEVIGKAGMYHDESMLIMMPHDIERAIIHLPTELINKSNLMVTEHYLERPRSLNERVVRIFIGPKRKSTLESVRR